MSRPSLPELMRQLDRKFNDPAYLESLRKEMVAIREACEARLLREHPIAFPMASSAAAEFRRSIGVNGVPSGVSGDPVRYPRWLDDVSPAIDGCGRPYVRVMLSQWTESGVPRVMVGPRDAEIPALPRKVSGIPVIVGVSSCFGRGPCPGENGEPCVDLPELSDPPSASDARVERLKAAVGAHLGDLGELDDCCDEEASLPSGRAWVAFVRDGDVGALGGALVHTALRAALIGAGLAAVGARRETLVRDAVAGSLGVDAFILMWSLCQK